MADDRRPFWLGLLSIFPLLLWWLGWFPGFLSPDSVDQLGQAARFSFTNVHPAFHSLYLWALMRLWETPAVVGLAQLLGLALLLGLAARRLVGVGVPPWSAVGAAWVAALLPAVGPTTIAIWKDIPYGLALLWLFTELLLLAQTGEEFWDGRLRAARLGGALALVWLFRHNGVVVVLLVGGALAVAHRRRWRGLVTAGATLSLVVALVLGALYRVLPVDTRTASTDVLIGDVAALVTHHPSSFRGGELDYLERIAPLEVWRAEYTCYDSTLLSFDPRFDRQVLWEDPGPFWSLAGRAALRHPLTVLGNHACASSYLFVPFQPQGEGTHLHRPPYDIPENELGIERNPISWKAFFLTRAVFVWAEEPGRLWLTWRPALLLWPALATYLGIALRRRLRPLLWPGMLVVAQGLTLTLTPLAQDFRFAYGLYLMSWLTLPLAWLVVRPGQAEVGGR